MSKKQWEKIISKLLVGKKIIAVRYQSDAEVEDFGWYGKGLFIQLDDGTQLLPMQDDEGNGPGAIATNSDKIPTIPIIHFEELEDE
mgnify:CR=1 FL=1